MIDFPHDEDCDCDECFDEASFEVTELIECSNLQKNSSFYEDELWKIVQAHPFHAKEWMQEQALIRFR